ncbi:SRPBCC family protein [Lewinella sp. 4G2]|uniref:SRPBCC family protein n=1 Tax=Lewinella sp. 4G2 TaxID=1803372 RepID=UPI0007B4EF6B|nr:polyketide cyclase [Lewinella sp. 4G2]
MKITENILIAREATFLFDFTQDYRNRLSWDTFLRKAIILNNAQEVGLGVKTYCESASGVGIETEYISFNRPNVTAVKMTSSNLIFKAFSGSWRFKKVHSSSTKVIFTYSFEFRWPFKLISRFIGYILAANMRGRLSDLKLYVEREYQSKATTN